VASCSIFICGHAAEYAVKGGGKRRGKGGGGREDEKEKGGRRNIGGTPMMRCGAA